MTRGHTWPARPRTGCTTPTFAPPRPPGYGASPGRTLGSRPPADRAPRNRPELPDPRDDGVLAHSPALGRVGNRLTGDRDAGSRENVEVASVSRSTVRTLLLGSRVQPGCGHPELATTIASCVATQPRWK